MAEAEYQERCARRSAHKEEELQIAVAYQHEHQEEANRREAMRVILNLEHSAIQAKAHEMQYEQERYLERVGEHQEAEDKARRMEEVALQRQAAATSELQ
eukprot:4638646-Pyramimonas_sp.AAC.1